MNKLQKIQEIRRLLSGEDLSPAKAYFIKKGEAMPETFRKGKDWIIYVNDPEMEAKAKALNPGLFVGVTDADTARELVQWLNDELPPREPMEVQPMQPEAIEQPAPMPEPQPMEAPAPIEPAAIPPAAIPMQPRTIANPRAGYRVTHI